MKYYIYGLVSIFLILLSQGLARTNNVMDGVAAIIIGVVGGWMVGEIVTKAEENN